MDDLIEKMGDDEAPLDIKYVLNLHFPSPSNQDQLLSILHVFFRTNANHAYIFNRY